MLARGLRPCIILFDLILFFMHLNTNLSKNILTWYDINKRILPWRVTKNQKKIIIAF